MLKKVQLWSMLGHKSNGKGRMLFILNKDSYTLEEDVNHHTVNILLPQNIENERSMTIISFSALGLSLIHICSKGSFESTYCKKSINLCTW